MADVAEAAAMVIVDKTARQVTRPLINVAIAFIIINTAFVAAKTYSRHQIARLPFWWDDLWIFPAWILIICIAAMGISMAQVEIAWNNTNTIIQNLDELKILLKLIFAIVHLLLMSFMFTRFSILALYLRIFTGKNIRRAIWATIGFVIVQYIAYAITTLKMCTPMALFWDRRIEGGTCFDIDSFFRSITIPNLAVDVVAILLPIPTIWQLKASNFRKWALTLLFGNGAIALAATCIRLWIYETHTAKIIAPQFTNVMILWLIVEPSIYLIAVCGPGMHHLFANMVPRRVSEWFSKRMAALSYDKSSTHKHENTLGSQSSRAGKSFIFGASGDFKRLADEGNYKFDGFDGPQSTAKAETKRMPKRKGLRSGAEAFEMGPTMEGITVTTEVIVTQEERIASIIGY